MTLEELLVEVRHVCAEQRAYASARRAAGGPDHAEERARWQGMCVIAALLEVWAKERGPQ